jgi:hypothetical protein
MREAFAESMHKLKVKLYCAAVCVCVLREAGYQSVFIVAFASWVFIVAFASWVFIVALASCCS